MDFDKVLADLHEQLKNLDTAIESLERLQNGNGSRPRGHPSNGGPPRKGTRKTEGDALSGKKRV
jgi:hypothetical protein